MPVLMPTMPYPALRPRGRRGLNHGRRNRRQTKLGVIGLCNHIGFIFKTERGARGPNVSSFDTLALAGTSPEWSAGRSCRRVRVLYRRKPTRTFLQGIGNMLFHFCYRFSSISGPMVTPFSSPSPMCSLSPPAVIFRQSGHTRRPARIKVGADAGLPGVAEFRGQCAFPALSRSASSKTINGALPPSSATLF